MGLQSQPRGWHDGESHADGSGGFAEAESEGERNKWSAQIPQVPFARGKEMSLSRCIGLYYKLPKSDPYAVYQLPNAVYLLQCNDNSLFLWKLIAQQTINTAIKISVNVNWCYSTPRLFCNYCCQISACSLSFKNQIFYMQDQSHLFQIAWNLCSVGCTTKTTFSKIE